MTCSDDHTCRLTRMPHGFLRVECLRCGEEHMIAPDPRRWSMWQIAGVILAAIVLLAIVWPFLWACYHAAGRGTPVKELSP